MAPIFRVVRLSNRTEQLEEKLYQRAWTAITEARQMLADNPRPDTFAGRKTQEPFPSEEDL
jgi:hypothetical protein